MSPPIIQSVFVYERFLETSSKQPTEHVLRGNPFVYGEKKICGEVWRNIRKELPLRKLRVDVLKCESFVPTDGITSFVAWL